MIMLNLGCGDIIHDNWINVDFKSKGKNIINCDIRKPLPYPDNSVDVVYCSHVLEHLKQETTEMVLSEIFRIMKPSGIIRVLVPDLEVICKNYLKYLELSLAGEKSAEFKYDYSMLEMYDQTVRTESGGRLGKLLKSIGREIPGFVEERNGYEVNKLSEVNGYKMMGNIELSFVKKALNKLISGFRNFRLHLSLLYINVLLGTDYAKSFKDGIFRNSGEIHLWMYDRFSMKRLLQTVGFKSINVTCANKTKIYDFQKYNFEIVDSMERKPDSLYMEAVK